MAFIGLTVMGDQLLLHAVAPMLYPPVVRSTGVGWAIAIGRLGAIVSPWAVGLALDAELGQRDLLWLMIPAILIAGCAALATDMENVVAVEGAHDPATMTPNAAPRPDLGRRQGRRRPHTPSGAGSCRSSGERTMWYPIDHDIDCSWPIWLAAIVISLAIVALAAWLVG